MVTCIESSYQNHDSVRETSLIRLNNSLTPVFCGFVVVVVEPSVFMPPIDQAIAVLFICFVIIFNCK